VLTSISICINTQWSCGYGCNIYAGAVTAIPFILSAPLPLLANTFPTVVCNFQELVVGNVSSKTNGITNTILALAISQFNGFNFHIFDKKKHIGT
jgi:hypothetical protein